MSEFTGYGHSSYASPFGDYDNPSGEPSPKYSKISPSVLLSPLSPSLDFSKLQLETPGSTESITNTGSDDSDDELRDKSEKLSQFEFFFKQSLLQFNASSLLGSTSNDLVSEDEKKRLRNTEAARRCREKIKRKTDDLEQQLTGLTAQNDLMNQHRIRLLSQVEEQMRMLEMMKKRNPESGAAISYEAKRIVDSYTEQVEAKRKEIREFFDRNCNKTY
ncbi:hypothetical protein L5515_008215 [Caenorhabditis briggsae]|uniref:BZIP domain-containing protein n=1 Tax=Caenorhabditis briggsae TaxID=6238 RepID=A0AAE9F0R3_CAEBR|nr:hypothetical protein L3Y34_008367 [Caenorhabditis briggsae]UMM35725.1 hypothetical protein L5515_008215 [Caenorhabditis briggsae]